MTKPEHDYWTLRLDAAADTPFPVVPMRPGQHAQYLRGCMRQCVRDARLDPVRLGKAIDLYTLYAPRKIFEDQQETEPRAAK